MMSFVATTQPDAAKAFYGDVLGLALAEDSPFALVFSGGGRMLRVAKAADFTPLPFTVLGWTVPDIATAVADLAGKGVVFEFFPGLPQDTTGIWTAPNGDIVAWFKDPDGNLLSLTEFG
jgi:catechol 2,3-dioxygenase-like lactoylglutathione lyase family enzyme